MAEEGLNPCQLPAARRLQLVDPRLPLAACPPRSSYRKNLVKALAIPCTKTHQRNATTLHPSPPCVSTGLSHCYPTSLEEGRGTNPDFLWPTFMALAWVKTPTVLWGATSGESTNTVAKKLPFHGISSSWNPNFVWCSFFSSFLFLIWIRVETSCHAKLLTSVW